MKFWEFKALADNKAELYMYGVISREAFFDDDITAKQFKDDLDALGDIDTLDIYMNSPGGDVFTGWAIINILQRNKATTIGHNDGLVASIAFDIYQSLDKRIAAKASMFMTHNCWGIIMGNSKELRKAADEMDKIDAMMVDITAKKSGKSVEEIKAIQDAETWYTGTEAVAEGFADELEEKVALAACISPEILAQYKHPPETIIAAIEPPKEPDNGEPTPQPVADKPQETAQPDALKEQRKRMYQLKNKLYGGIKNG
jgi:ATP-dependent Clp protease protease subunit